MLQLLRVDNLLHQVQVGETFCFAGLLIACKSGHVVTLPCGQNDNDGDDIPDSALFRQVMSIRELGRAVL